MAQTSTKPSLSVKLLIDTKAKSVLFAEASKDIVDFLFSLMSLPIGSVISILSAAEMAGSLGKVYQSLETLGDTYVQPEANKATLLKPNAKVFHGAAKLLSLPIFADPSFYICGNCRRYVTYGVDEPCPHCTHKMSTSVPFLKSKEASSSMVTGGYVKDVVTYMVMDDLEVKPMSTISTIALINKYGIREMGDLEESVVAIGMDEGLKLLKVSFESKTVLTDVFLGREVPA